MARLLLHFWVGGGSTSGSRGSSPQQEAAAGGVGVGDGRVQHQRQQQQQPPAEAAGGVGWAEVGVWGKGKMQQQAGHYNPIQSLLTRHFLSSEKGCRAIDFETK